jgi:hypothetical protein
LVADKVGYWKLKSAITIFIGDVTGADQPLAEKTGAGEIVRPWI